MTIDRVEYLRYQRILGAAQDRPDRLSDWEQEFVNDWTDRFERRGCNVVVSEAQSNIFDKLERKLDA